MTALTRTALVVAVAVLFASGCGDDAEGPRRGVPEIPAPEAVTARGSDAVRRFERGQDVLAQSGCLACHQIGENGNDGPGPHLDDVGARLDAEAIAETLVSPTSPMPSYEELKTEEPERFDDLVAFLAGLR